MHSINTEQTIIHSSEAHLHQMKSSRDSTQEFGVNAERKIDAQQEYI